MGRCPANRNGRQYETREGVVETALTGYIDLQLRVPSNFSYSNHHHDRTARQPQERSVSRAEAPLPPAWRS